jgi:hypothetical protein
MSMPSLAQATSTHLDTACKHIQQCRVSQDHMAKFVKPGLDSDDLIRNKYRYCVHKDELVIGIGKCWAPDAQSKRFQNNAYPRVVSNLGGLVERDGDEPSDAERLIRIMYHNASSITERDWILGQFRDALWRDFQRVPARPADVMSFKQDPLDANHMKFRNVIPNIYDFVTVGYANTLGWAHAHCGDTMTSVLIGGLRTVMNGDFEVHTGDMIQWYWPFELGCFEKSGRRKPRAPRIPALPAAPGAPAVPAGATRLDLQVDPVDIQPLNPGHDMVEEKETALRRMYYERQYGQKRGTEKVVPLIKPYKRDDEAPRLYDWYRVFAVALSTARPREHVDIRIARQAL